jgi:cell division transport system ATP-binding protein
MLKLVNITKRFGDVLAADNVTFDVDNGEFVFITGPSGSGKSTIIRLVLRQIVQDSGDIFLDELDLGKLKEKEIPTLRQRMGVVFQDFKMIPERTLWENIEIALAVTKVPQSEWKDRVAHVLKLVGLEKRSNFFPSQLAGGEIQRGSLARALVTNPSIILADEPTGNLDWKTADKILELFEEINKEGKTIVMATHHLGIIEKHKKRVIELKEGKVVSDSGHKKVEKENSAKEKEVKETK